VLDRRAIQEVGRNKQTRGTVIRAGQHLGVFYRGQSEETCIQHRQSSGLPASLSEGKSVLMTAYHTGESKKAQVKVGSRIYPQHRMAESKTTIISRRGSKGGCEMVKIRKTDKFIEGKTADRMKKKRNRSRGSVRKKGLTTSGTRKRVDAIEE